MVLIEYMIWNISYIINLTVKFLSLLKEDGMSIQVNIWQEISRRLSFFWENNLWKFFSIHWVDRGLQVSFFPLQAGAAFNLPSVTKDDKQLTMRIE